MKLAFMGSMGSGKTHYSEVLKKKYPSIDIISFATPIKEIAIKYFSMSEEKKDRALLINLGKGMKKVEPKVFLHCLQKNIENKQHIIVDDLRFLDEIIFLKEMDFQLIRIDIDRDVQIQRLKNKYEAAYTEHVKYIKDASENIHMEIQPDLILDIKDDSEEERQKNKLKLLNFVKSLDM